MTEEEAVSELDNKGDDSLTSSSIFLFALNKKIQHYQTLLATKIRY